MLPARHPAQVTVAPPGCSFVRAFVRLKTAARQKARRSDGVSANGAVLRPCQHKKLARGAQDKEDAMSQKINAAMV
jgi:hypothetical protein